MMSEAENLRQKENRNIMSSKRTRLPTIDTLYSLLDECQSVHIDMPRHEELDVRLAVEDNGSWSFLFGCVDYDNVHSAHCAASVISQAHTPSELRDVARDLLAQVRESIALAKQH